MKENIKEKLNSPIRDIASELTKSLSTLTKTIEESKRSPMDTLAIFAKDLNKTLQKLVEVSDKEIKDGKDGENGISVASAVVNELGELELIFSDGDIVNVGVVKGKDGETPIVNEDEIATRIFSKLSIPKINTEEIVSKVIAKLPKDKQTNAKYIIAKIKQLKALSYEDIADLPDIVALIQKYTAHLEGGSRTIVGSGASAISRMLDVDLAGLTTGSVLTWNGSAWTAGSVATVDGTQTLTNKRINPRLVTAASYTTDTGTSLDVSTCDQFEITAQAGALKFNNPGGTAVGGQKLIIRIKDNGTAQALTYDTEFRAMGVALPSTTVLSKTLYLGLIFNATDTKWDLIAAAQEE